MKKILIATNILLLGIIIFYASNGSKAMAQTDTRGASEYTVDLKGFAPNEDREGLIDFNMAASMSRAFRNDAGKGKITGTSKRDASAIWFSLDMLKDFLNKVDNSIPLKKCRPLLGIRIYYAKYPGKLAGCLADLNSTVSSHHTVFMVPTYRDTILMKDVDFNLDYIGPDPCRPIPYAKLGPDGKQTLSILGSNKKKYYEYKLPGGAVPYIPNHGGLSPPPDDEGIFPTPQN